jgi:hypothetical protein
VGRNRGDLGLFLTAADRTRKRADGLDRYLDSPVEAPLQVDRARASRDVLQAVGVDRVGQDGGCARAITDGVTRPLGRLPQHARSKVFVRILQFDFLGDRYSIVADQRPTPFLLDQHALRSRSQGDTNRIG